MAGRLLIAVLLTVSACALGLPSSGRGDSSSSDPGVVFGSGPLPRGKALTPPKDKKPTLTSITIKFARRIVAHTALLGAYWGAGLAIDAAFDTLGVDSGVTSTDITVTMMNLHPVTKRLRTRYSQGGRKVDPSSALDVASWAKALLEELGTQVALTGGLTVAYYGGPTAVEATLQALRADELSR